MNTPADMADFLRLLKVTGHQPDDLVSVCYRKPEGTFTATLGKASDAPARAAVHVGTADLWFGVNALRADAELAPGQRGSAEDVARIVALFTDLDAKPQPAGLGSTEACRAVVDTVSATLGGCQPVAVVESGTGGLHPYWRLKPYPPEQHPRAVQLLRRFGLAVQAIARQAGGAVDNVHEPARVLRVPGSVNLKPGGGAVTVEFYDDDNPDVAPDSVTLDMLEEWLDEAGVPDAPEPVGDTGPRVPFEGWAAGASTCGYVRAMVASWAADNPPARHPKMLGSAFRLFAAARLGCITGPDFVSGLAALEQAFAKWCARPGDARPVKPLEVLGALEYARQAVETRSEEACWQELGGHVHVGGEVPGSRPAGAGADAEAGGDDDARLRGLEERLFTATPLLDRIREAARSRVAPPWAVFGAVLARVNAEIPPNVVLPPVIFSRASLNLAVALVETSGGGKSGSAGLSAELLNITEPKAKPIGPGTGEGIIQSFLKWDDEKGKNVPDKVRHALLLADEVAQIGAVQERSGATSGSVMRTMLTGGEVSTTNATASRNRQLFAHSYRLAVLAGIQPHLSGVLLKGDEADAGTPQRWLWLPTFDPDAPDEEPAWPGSLDWTPPDLNSLPLARLADGFLYLEVPAEVAAEIKAAQRQRTRSRGRGGLAGLDGHRMLTREKVAATLAWLHGEVDITIQWWDLAGVVLEVSDIARGWCLAALVEKDAKGDAGRGRADAVREAAARAVRVEASERYARLLWSVVHRHQEATERDGQMSHDPGQGCTRRCLVHALRNHKGADREAAVEAAVDLGWMEDSGGRFYPGTSRPADS